MHRSAIELEDNSLLQGDICIIGSGPAGISLALELESTGRKVILLEGGSFQYDSRMQELYRPDSVSGQNYYRIQDSRLHYFGGTSGHWGGYCTQFDAHDFTRRDWVENSGWPFDKTELLPFYKKATNILDLDVEDFNLDFWRSRLKDLKTLELDHTRFDSKIWQLSDPTRFGIKYKERIVSSENIFLYTDANVKELSLEPGTDRISEVTISNFGKKEHRVKATEFVLACGSIQNARLLLSSNKQRSNGIGNEYDHVGRYFMEHLEVKIADIWFKRPLDMELYWSSSANVRKVRAELQLSPQQAQKENLLSSTLYFVPMRYQRRVDAKFKRWKTEGKPKLSRSVFDKLENRFNNLIDEKTFDENMTYGVFTRVEQVPKPSSRITLSSQKDELEMPRINFHWEVSELEKRTCLRVNQLFGQQLGIKNLGRMKFDPNYLEMENSQWSKGINGAWHHMGTTRMHLDPKKGVVDENCRVHSVSNLYIASGSCFPTSSAVNPTMTIVALSLRLANHLKMKQESLSI